MKLKYFKSNKFNTHFYECLNCGLDMIPKKLEGCSGINCKCGVKFTSDDIIQAKDEYIRNLEIGLCETKIDTLAEIITFNALNKIREYHGRTTIESNEFVEELQNDTKEYIKNIVNATN